MVEHLDEVGIGALRERRVIFHEGTETGYVRGIEVIHEDDGVGIAQAQARHAQRRVRVQERVHHRRVRRMGQGGRNRRGVEAGRAEVDADEEVGGIRVDNFRHAQATGRSHDKLAYAVPDALLVDEARQAADAVAAHAGDSAVAIIEVHRDVGVVGREDEQQAISADALVAVTQGDGQGRRLRQRRRLPRIHEDEIVAQPVVLGEGNTRLRLRITVAHVLSATFLV